MGASDVAGRGAGRRGREVEDHAVVLRTGALGEADLWVTLWTRRAGKLRLAAPSARKSRRRFPGGLAPGRYGVARFVPARGERMGRLAGFAPSPEDIGGGRDLSRFAYVGYLCEITDALRAVEDPDPAAFDLLAAALGRLARGRAEPVLLRRYELGLLEGLGAAPSAQACAVCGGVTEGDRVAYAPERGGALCGLHASPGDRRIPRVHLEAMVRVAAWDLRTDPPALPPGGAGFLRAATRAALVPHMRRPLRSLDTLRALLRPTADMASRRDRTGEAVPGDRGGSAPSPGRDR